MSWGERSCKHSGCCPANECTATTCRVCCGWYEWDGKTEPDSTHYWGEVIPLRDAGRIVGQTRLCHFCGKRIEDYTAEMSSKQIKQ